MQSPRALSKRNCRKTSSLLACVWSPANSDCTCASVGLRGSVPCAAAVDGVIATIPPGIIRTDAKISAVVLLRCVPEESCHEDAEREHWKHGGGRAHDKPANPRPGISSQHGGSPRHSVPPVEKGIGGCDCSRTGERYVRARIRLGQNRSAGVLTVRFQEPTRSCTPHGWPGATW